MVSKTKASQGTRTSLTTTASWCTCLLARFGQGTVDESEDIAVDEVVVYDSHQVIRVVDFLNNLG